MDIDSESSIPPREFKPVRPAVYRHEERGGAGGTTPLLTVRVFTNAVDSGLLLKDRLGACLWLRRGQHGPNLLAEGLDTVLYLLDGTKQFLFDPDVS